MNDDLTSTIEAWRVASTALGVRVQAPYHARALSGDEAMCVAHLPDFGSPKGMLIGGVIGPNFETDRTIKRVANELGKYCSFINIKVYTKYEEAVFKEALRDWGYWGADDQRPRWLQDPQ